MITAETLFRDDPFYSPKYSISRGWYHVDEFKTRVQAFLDSDPYEIVTEVETDSGDYVQKIKLVKPIPQDLEGWAVDAAGNFRSALDQAMFIIAGKKTYFPSGKTVTEFENSVKGRCKGMPEEMIDVIRRFKVYIGGDDHLWSLVNLAGTNKHGIIVPIASVFGQMSADAQWDFAKNEVELNRFAPSSLRFKSNLTGSVFVGFYGIDPIEGDEAAQALDFMGIGAEMAIKGMEMEAQRLGIIDHELDSQYRAILGAMMSATPEEKP
jgi:hypothetical protein